MARAIDADVLKEALLGAIKDAPLYIQATVEQYIDEAPILTSPNEPLTLEELREMDGEPAYLKVFDPRIESGWHIIKTVTEDKIIFRGWHTVYVPISGMGVDYNLYRRPPEGGEATNGT